MPILVISPRKINNPTLAHTPLFLTSKINSIPSSPLDTGIYLGLSLPFPLMHRIPHEPLIAPFLIASLPLPLPLPPRRPLIPPLFPLRVASIPPLNPLHNHVFVAAQTGLRESGGRTGPALERGWRLRSESGR